MNEHDFSARGRPPAGEANRAFGDKIEYSLNSEERLLQSISSRAPLPKVLNEICTALDCQIGNAVSIILLPGEDAGDLAAIAMNAALFGLFTFCSEGIVDGNDGLLGFLEMYCSVARTPNASEFQLIERAKCLAAIAIKRHNDAGEQDVCDSGTNKRVREGLQVWPVSTS
jgi:hypothetical protein